MDVSRNDTRLQLLAKKPSIPIKDAFMVAVAAGLGYAFDAYAVNIFGLTLPYIGASLHLNLSELGLLGSIFLLGYTIGTIGFGWLCDRMGRKDTLGITILLYGITTALSGVTAYVPLFGLLRFLTGVGGAGELAVGAPYTAEMWPPRYRALGTGGIIFSLYSLGYIVAAGAALIIVPRFGWQWAFISAVVPSILVFIFIRRIKESERYIIAKEEAFIEEEKKFLPRQPSLFSLPGAPRRIIVGWLLYIANACGYWSVTVFLTTFMIRKFHITPEHAILYALEFYIIQFVLSYVGTGLSDLIGRRPAGILGALIMIGATIVASTTSSFTLFLIFGALMVGMLGWLWGIGDTYLSEFFRTSMRGTAFGVMVGGGRLVSIAAPFLTGYGISHYGPTVPFLLTSLLWVLTIVGYLLGPETAGRELEDVQL
ncbi:MFS transporter [Acidiphilium iwatense]|uniref:MFS transporter n=1 Tax=Acidiphilium iwatense TaxID=768198 RepID=A0ABS9E2Z5_9PROT|nr:MFS transporter [Acidiphilium iwatense]MCF3948755.1 MFS transporter [Acidiphilium iwatense]